MSSFRCSVELAARQFAVDAARMSVSFDAALRGRIDEALLPFVNQSIFATPLYVLRELLEDVIAVECGACAFVHVGATKVTASKALQLCRVSPDDGTIAPCGRVEMAVHVTKDRAVDVCCTLTPTTACFERRLDALLNQVACWTTVSRETMSEVRLTRVGARSDD